MHLDEASVTGTANLVMAAVMAKGETVADKRGFNSRGAFRGGRHAAECDAGGGDFIARTGDVETAAQGGNILVEPFADFVTFQVVGLIGDRDADDKFAGATVLFSVGDEEVFDWDVSDIVAAPQVQLRAKRDERGRAITDGGTVGDVAPDGGGIAHLCAAVAADQLGKAGVFFGHSFLKLGQGDGRADCDAAVARFDAAQIFDLANEGDGGQIAQLFVDP